MEMINSFKDGDSQGIRGTKLGAFKAFYAFSVLVKNKLTENVPPDARNLIYKIYILVRIGTQMQVNLKKKPKRY